jgi:hypothetical protein
VVIGDRFAWGHLEKTGGDATLELFGEVPELVRFADRMDSHDKHCPFRDRESEVHGKVLALNIRRLPAWLLSKAQHAARYGLYPDYEPWHMASPTQMTESREPDQRLGAFTDNGRFQIDRWLRTEFLGHDFLAFVSDFMEVSESSRKAIVELAHVHAAATAGYDHHVDHWFSPDQVRRMYERNPAWAELERRVFGDIPSGGPGRHSSRFNSASSRSGRTTLAS